MKKGAYKSIIQQISLVSIALLIIAVVIFMIYSIIVLRNNAIISAKERILSNGKQYSYEFENEIEQILDAAKAMTQTLSSVKFEENRLEIDRDQVNSILQSILFQNKSFFSVYSLWEPNAFDQNDDNYIDALSHDRTGRFIPYFTRNDKGDIVNEYIELNNTEGIGKYYQIIKRNNENIISNIYLNKIQNKNVELITLACPISYKHSFYGVTGIEISIDYLKKIIKNTWLFEGQADISIISSDGTFILNSRTDSIVGKNLENLYKNFYEQIAEIDKGLTSTNIEDNKFEMRIPIIIGDLQAYWQMRISLPIEALNKEAQSTIYPVIIIGIIFIIIFVITSLIIIRRNLFPIIQISDSIKKLSTGDFDIKSTYENNNEIGQISESIVEISNLFKKIIKVTHSISKGDFFNYIEQKSNKDEIAKAINQMNINLKKAEEDNERGRREVILQNWASAGLAELSEILRRTTHDIENLSFEIIKKLVNQLNATQGGVFIYNDSDKNNPNLELRAAFAFDRRRYFDKHILPGEGLIGTCALEKETIYLTKIPENYVEIVSGLGGSAPRSLIVVPLKLENVILGVIEITSFNEFQNHEIEFVERASESIALTLSNVKINARTIELLEQSREQADALAIQEQQMRQNLEELKMIQEESSRKESEMRGLINALNITSMVAELNMEGEIIKMNEAFCRLLGKREEEITGTHHTKIIRGTLNDQFVKFWQDILDGNTKKIEEERIQLSDERELWLSEIYTPILDNGGNPYKVLVTATDNTKRKKQEEEYLTKTIDLKIQKIELTKMNLENAGLMKAIDDFALESEYTPNGIIIRVNDYYLKTLGFAIEELVDRNLFEFIEPEEKENFNKIWEQISNGLTVKLLIERKNKVGNSLWLNTSFIPMTDDNGKLFKIYSLALDVTHYINAEHEAIEKIHDLENKIKNHQT